MRRLSLSAKLFAAVLPLLVAIGALLTSSIRTDFDEVAQARRGAELGSTWEMLIASIEAVDSEQGISATADQAAIDDARQATNTSMTDLRQVVRDIGDGDAMVLLFDSATSALNKARVGVNVGDEVQVTESGIGTTTGTLVAVQEFDNAQRALIDIGRLLPDEAGEVELASALYAVGTLAATERLADSLVQKIGDWPESRYLSDVVEAAALGDAIVASVGEFENIAPEEWLAEFNDGQWAQRLSVSANELDDIVAAADRDRFLAFHAPAFNETISGIATVREGFASEIVADANSQANALQRTTILRIGITLVAVLLAALMTFFLTRSITRRVRAVSDRAREVATIQLPALVSALGDPRGRAVIPDVTPIEHAGSDELGELANAFNMVQSTLVDVAHQQVEVLRRGVSNIFVTMARRTRSLIDRQLALLDDLESDVDDPSVLANYYQLDHLATRMRRNSESLLVLANAESRRRRTKPIEVDDVVRAAIGEVEDYRRIDVLDLEHLQVSGAVVADTSHLLAELLDNATSFSPPESRVTVSGRFADDHYVISIADDGVGISADRLVELNDILANPPIVGLSVEPTLGMSVVSLLAHKHGVQVRLVPGLPGLLVEVVLPATVYGAIATTATLVVEATSNGDASVAAPDNTFEWTGGMAHTDTFVPGAVTVEPPTAPVVPMLTPEPAVAEQTFEWPTTPEWEPAPDPVSDMATPEESPAEESREALPAESPDAESDESEEPDVPVEPMTAAGLEPPTFTPPQSHDRLSGEFDRPPAPPVFGTRPTSRPFIDPTARPIPAWRTESERSVPTGPASSSLPTRARGTGPNGPDRLAHLTSPDGQPPVQATPTAPSSLRAALNAFEAGRAGARPQGTESSAPQPPAPLPTRDPGSAFDHDEVTVSTAQSRLDPEVIRERLRSFRQEFQLGRDGEAAAGHDGDQNDLGGDR